MRKFKFKLDRKSLQTMYFSFIRPVLEYADVIWNNCTQYESNELEKNSEMKRRVLSLVQQSWYQLTLSYQKQAGKLFRQGGTNIN